ncbi:MAG: ABC transporter permease subunit [Phycisphaerae bacterium]
MSKVWAVAGHMIAEGIRMKIALVFLVLVALVVLGLPFSIQGDSSVTGAVQSFLSYSLSATGVLLGMLTIFMSRSLADELVNRQIYLVMTKPIPRWQYILGKWVGISTLNLAFLSCAGITIYGMVHYIRWTHPPIDEVFDEKELENEVLVARHALQCELPEFKKLADLEFERNLEQGLYDNVPDFIPTEERARLGRKYEAKWRVVGPNEFRVFEFTNVLCDRTRGHEVQIRYKTDVTNYPPDETFRGLWRVGNPNKGTPVYDLPVRQVVGRFHTVRVPADAVASDHTLTAYFFNSNPFQGERQYNNIMEFRKSSGVELLFIVGTFSGNLLRLMVLMYCKLLFLAAVSVLMTTAFSFPVACLSSFTVYVFAGAQSFLADAMDWVYGGGAVGFGSAIKSYFADPWALLKLLSLIKQLFLGGLGILVIVVFWVTPDFGRYDAVETLVNGRNVSLVWVLQGIVSVAILRTSFLLGLAMLLFHRREVAEVSV